MSNILISGHKGNVGSRLVKYFDDFDGIDNKDGKNLLTAELPENIDIIYHLAAHAPVEYSWKDPVRTMENISSTVRLVQNYPNAKLIFAYTGASLEPESSPYAFSNWVSKNYIGNFKKNMLFCILQTFSDNLV